MPEGSLTSTAADAVAVVGRPQALAECLARALKRRGVPATYVEGDARQEAAAAYLDGGEPDRERSGGAVILLEAAGAAGAGNGAGPVASRGGQQVLVVPRTARGTSRGEPVPAGAGLEDLVALIRGGPARARPSRPMRGRRASSPEAGLLEHLTPREREVLLVLMAGASNRRIGARLEISHHTVRTHVQNIRAKLGVSSRLEAAALALQAGLEPAVPDPETDVPGAVPE